MTEPADVYVRLERLRQQVADAEQALGRLGGSVPPDCGDPAHAGIAERAEMLEAEVRDSTAAGARARRMTAKIEGRRRETLSHELVRLEAKAMELRPKARGDRRRLAEFKAARARQFALEMLAKGGKPTRREVVDIGGLERPMPMVPFAAVATVVALGLAFVGASTQGILAWLGVAAGLAGLSRIAFSGAHRHLISADSVYGSPWRHVRSIVHTQGQEPTLQINLDAHQHLLTARSLGFTAAVDTALAAAKAHGVPIISRDAPVDEVELGE